MIFKFFRELKEKREKKIRRERMISWYENKFNYVPTAPLSELCKLLRRQESELQGIRIQEFQAQDKEKKEFLRTHIELSERLIRQISERIRRSCRKVC